MTKIMSRAEMLSMRPGDVQNGDVFAVKVVAVAGHAGDWAAYMGPTSWPDEKVIEVGQKLTESQVGSLFYIMCARVYRE